MDTYNQILYWISKHWMEILGALGISGGSGVIGKKMTDKKQDEKILKMGLKIADLDKKIISIQKDIDTNTAFDKQFRLQMEGKYSDLKESISDVKKGVDMLVQHMLNKAT